MPPNRNTGCWCFQRITPSALWSTKRDHLRIQVITNGLDLAKAYQLCNQIDDVLDETLTYAFDEKLGYLTSCPTNLGTGLRASVMMHLPALEQTGLISQLTSTINKLGLTIRGTYGEGSSVIGSIYQISNQITLGITEQDAIQNLESVARQIIESEEKGQRKPEKSGQPPAGGHCVPQPGNLKIRKAFVWERLFQGGFQCAVRGFHGDNP